MTEREEKILELSIYAINNDFYDYNSRCELIPNTNKYYVRISGEESIQTEGELINNFMQLDSKYKNEIIETYLKEN